MDGCWLPRQVVLEERVSQRAAHYLMTLTPDDLKKYNPPSKHHCKTEGEFKAAHEKLRVFLHTPAWARQAVCSCLSSGRIHRRRGRLLQATSGLQRRRL